MIRVSIKPGTVHSLPERLIFRGRALPMLHLLKGTSSLRSQLQVIQRQDRLRLANQRDQRLRDFVMESHF